MSGICNPGFYICKCVNSQLHLWQHQSLLLKGVLHLGLGHTQFGETEHANWSQGKSPYQLTMKYSFVK